MYSYYNGEIKKNASIDISSAGFQFGYGVFETILLMAGKPCFLEEHYKRLQQGCDKLGLQVSQSCQDYLEQACELSRQLDILEGRLKIICFRDMDRTSSIMTLLPYSLGQTVKEKGYSLKLSRSKRNPHSALVYIKSLNYTENILEREAAMVEGYDDALFLNTAGKLCESTTANIFWIKDRCIYTPDTSCGILEGVTRAQVIELCKHQGFELKLGGYELQELLQAEEVFITNSLIGILPVSRIDQHAFDVTNNIITKALQKEFAIL